MLTKPLPGVIADPLHQLSKGCVFHLLLNEGSGSRAYDVSGHGNHGTLKNMCPNVQGSKWQGSKFGGGLAFDGTDDYVDMGNTNDLCSSFSISIWSKINTVGLSVQCLLSKMPDAVVWWQLQIKNSGSATPGHYTFQFDDDADKRVLNSNKPMDDNLWHYSVITRNASGYILYVDGIVHDTAASNGDLANSGNLLMGLQTFQGYYLNGTIDEVRIYNRALSAQEIKQLYHDPFCNLLRVPTWQRYVSIGAIARSYGYIFG